MVWCEEGCGGNSFRCLGWSHCLGCPRGRPQPEMRTFRPWGVVRDSLPGENQKGGGEAGHERGDLVKKGSLQVKCHPSGSRGVGWGLWSANCVQGGVHPCSGQGSWAQQLSPSWAWLQAVDGWSGGDRTLRGLRSLWQIDKAAPVAPGPPSRKDGRWAVKSPDHPRAAGGAQGQEGQQGWPALGRRPGLGGVRCCCCPAAQSCPTLCEPVDCSTPGLPVPHDLRELGQTHIHRGSDAIRPSHSLHPYSSCPQSFPASEVQGYGDLRGPEPWPHRTANPAPVSPTSQGSRVANIRGHLKVKKEKKSHLSPAYLFF